MCHPSDIALTASDWMTLAGTLAAAFAGAWFGHSLAQKADRKRERANEQALLAALQAEVDYCAQQAATYIEQNIMAPAYRLPRKVYDVAFPILVGSVFDANDVTALIGFYSQVDQVNWGLGEVDRMVKDVGAGGIWASKEYERVREKAKEMMAPASRFYTPASEAIFRRKRP